MQGVVVSCPMEEETDAASIASTASSEAADREVEQQEEEPPSTTSGGDGLDELTTPQLRAMLNDLKRQLRKHQENALLESYLKRHVSVRCLRRVGHLCARALLTQTHPLSPRACRPCSPRSLRRLTRRSPPRARARCSRGACP